MKFYKLLQYTLIILLAIGFIACSDNGSGTDEGEPPSLPNLAEYSQPDVSYFGGFGTKVSTISASPNFQLAQGLVLGFSSFTSIGQIYTGFFEGALGENASFNDGVWEWSYSYSFGGSSSEVRLTAEETSTTVNWDLFISFSGDGLDFNNYNLMSGTTQNDGLQGGWTFNTFLDGSTGIPFLQSNWLVTGDNEQTNEVVIFDDEGTAQVNIDFEENGSEFLLEIDFTDESESDAEIFWNTDSEIGYVQQVDERTCWQGRGQNAVDVSCSDIGL